MDSHNRYLSQSLAAEVQKRLSIEGEKEHESERARVSDATHFEWMTKLSEREIERQTESQRTQEEMEKERKREGLEINSSWRRRMLEREEHWEREREEREREREEKEREWGDEREDLEMILFQKVAILREDAADTQVRACVRHSLSICLCCCFSSSLPLFSLSSPFLYNG